MYKAGQRYRSTDAIEAICLTNSRAPFSGGSIVTLPVGLKFELMTDVPFGATGAVCAPLHYERFEEIFVPSHERADGKYAGYLLTIFLRDIEQRCDSVESDIRQPAALVAANDSF